MPFEPVEMTNGTLTTMALTAIEATQLLWDGWVPVGGSIVIEPQFEPYIGREGATTGQVPVLQDNGTLAFDDAGVGGGAVDSVNGQTGDVVLDADDVGAAAEAHLHVSADISDATNLATPGTAVKRFTDGTAGFAQLQLSNAATGNGEAVRKIEHDADVTAAKDRANHTGTQASSTISDLTEAVQDVVGSFIIAGVGCTVSYDDVAGTFTINVTGGGGGGTADAESIRDTIGTALVAGSGIQITVNDVGDTITIASTAVLPTRQVIAGTGLAGGGDLSVDRTLSVQYGTTGTTAAAGNDSRIVNAVPNTRQVIAGAGLSGGGALSADRTLAVAYGSTANTAVQGNDTRVTADQAVGTASIRSLGDGPQQAAPGDHSHSRTIADAPAGAVYTVTQNSSDSTWPNRPTSRTDITIIWKRVIAGSGNPPAATTQGVTVDGSYNLDLVIGA